MNMTEIPGVTMWSMVI